MSAAKSSSVVVGCSLVIINCSCCAITIRSIEFAKASTRIRRLRRQRQALRSVRISWSTRIPFISLLCRDAIVCSSDCCAREMSRTSSCRRRRLYASLPLVGVCSRRRVGSSCSSASILVWLESCDSSS